MLTTVEWRGGAGLHHARRPFTAALHLFFFTVGEAQFHKALKQLAEIKADGSGLARYKAGGGHAGQGIDLQQGKAVVRPEDKVCPAVPPEAKRPV